MPRIMKFFGASWSAVLVAIASCLPFSLNLVMFVWVRVFGGRFCGGETGTGYLFLLAAMLSYLLCAIAVVVIVFGFVRKDRFARRWLLLFVVGIMVGFELNLGTCNLPTDFQR
jgi:hypothetical protein